jgi:hypothetical protein
MSVESVTGKSGAKKTIQDAIVGLLLALGSYLILYTINPNLVNLSSVNNLKSIGVTTSNVDLNTNSASTNSANSTSNSNSDAATDNGVYDNSPVE